MSRKQRGDPSKLPIRVRRVIARNGSETSQLTVFCPLQRKSLMLENCKICEHYLGGRAEGDGGDSSLICSHLTAEAVSEPVATDPVPSFGKTISAEALSSPVAGIMTRNVLCVRSDLLVDDLVLLLVEHAVSGVPVVNETGKPVGVVSRADLLWESYDEAEARTERTRGYALNGDDSSRAKSTITVAEIMTRAAVTLPESTSISEAAAIMARQGVHRAPIVDRSGLVVGILSAGDLLLWLARSAGHAVPNRFPRRK